MIQSALSIQTFHFAFLWQLLLIYICKINNLQPKRMLYLHKDISSKAKLVFVECILAGGEYGSYF